jgi:hypothetical protein
MKSSQALALGLMLIAAPAFANTELMITGGGGFTSELAERGCLDQGPGSCPANQKAGTALLGAGIARISDIGVRGSLKVEGALSFGEAQWRQVQILGAAGWQGDWLIVEGGLGTALLTSRDQSVTLGGLLHGGLGLRILAPLAVLARVDAAVSDEHRPLFLGLTLEWVPMHHSRP